MGCWRVPAQHDKAEIKGAELREDFGPMEVGQFNQIVRHITDGIGWKASQQKRLVRSEDR
jgi:hypothetical protein